MKKTVVVVEDDRGLREQLVQILDTAPDIKCVGAFNSGESALPEVLKRRPDVVLMDIKLPGMSGIQCVAEIKKVIPAIQIIMVTIYEDSERIFRALKAGADGYLVKSGPPEQLLNAIRDAYQGGAPISSHIARKVVKHFHLLGPSRQESENLSPREHQVLDLLAMGFIYKEIGCKLNIDPETVRSHVKNICQKMHVRSRVEAVAKHRTDAY
ncbi:MAG TPA: response regulator transcription factor [Verrucomicrobiae bacterium]|nr:response regulator transcription factor [Verrucomicrobiae bacterium]